MRLSECKILKVKTHNYHHTKMSNILQLVLFNIQPSFFQVKDLVIIRCASKECKTIVHDYLTYLFEKYNKQSLLDQCGREVSDKVLQRKPTCTKCNATCSKYNPFIMQHRCVNCYRNLITLTDAKKTYKLSDDDLVFLDYLSKYIQSYRKYSTLYWPPDVIGIAMLKHKQTTYTSLMDFLKKPKPTSKAYDSRCFQLEKAFKSFNENTQKQLYDLPQTIEFRKNGSNGIKSLTKIFNVYSDLKAYWDALDTLPLKSISFYLDLAVSSKSLDDITSQIQTDITILKEEEQRKRTRKSDLENALKLKNLSLRSDSKLCNDYINGIDTHTIQELVVIMEEMQFLHNHTSYPNSISYELNQAYNNAKYMIRDLYGYINNEEEYQEMLEGYVNKNRITEHCKKRAVQEYAKHNDLQQVPSSLHRFLNNKTQ